MIGQAVNFDRFCLRNGITGRIRQQEGVYSFSGLTLSLIELLIGLETFRIISELNSYSR